MSFPNHSANDSLDLKTPGMAKCNRAHSSSNEFQTGVPLNSTLFYALYCVMTCQRFVSLLLIIWPSSSTMHIHGILLKYLKSCTANEYDVTSTCIGQSCWPNESAITVSPDRMLLRYYTEPQYGHTERQSEKRFSSEIQLLSNELGQMTKNGPC